MDFTETQKEQIKKLQKLILSNVIACESDVRPNIIAKFKNVKYKNLTNEEIEAHALSGSIAAFFDEETNEVCIRTNLATDKNYEHILLHEMIHAYAFNNITTGFFCYQTSGLKNLDSKNYLLTLKMQMFNEAATEFYASIFLGQDPISYKFFVPIYAHLSETCGFEKLMTYYFTNNSKMLYETIKNTYHLENYDLIDKLFMQMEQCFNLRTGQQNLVLLKEAYKTLLEMNIQKAYFENGKQISNEDLEDIIDFNNILGIDKTRDSFVNYGLSFMRHDLRKHLNNYTPVQKHIDFEKTAQMVNDFIIDRLIIDKTVDYNVYKEYFKNNLCEVLLYLDQSNYYYIGEHFINNDLAINEVLNFMHDETGHIDLSHLSKEEKHYVVNAIYHNAKYNITNLQNQLYYADVMMEMEDEKTPWDLY